MLLSVIIALEILNITSPTSVSSCVLRPRNDDKLQRVLLILSSTIFLMDLKT